MGSTESDQASATSKDDKDGPKAPGDGDPVARKDGDRDGDGDPVEEDDVVPFVHEQSVTDPTVWFTGHWPTEAKDLGTQGRNQPFLLATNYDDNVAIPVPITDAYNVDPLALKCYAMKNKSFMDAPLQALWLPYIITEEQEKELIANLRPEAEILRHSVMFNKVLVQFLHLPSNETHTLHLNQMCQEQQFVVLLEDYVKKNDLADVKGWEFFSYMNKKKPAVPTVPTGPIVPHKNPPRLGKDKTPLLEDPFDPLAGKEVVAIISHEGPFRGKTELGSMWNVVVKLNDGSQQKAPLNYVKTIALSVCSKYAATKNLLNEVGWKSLDPMKPSVTVKSEEPISTLKKKTGSVPTVPLKRGSSAPNPRVAFDGFDDSNTRVKTGPFSPPEQVHQVLIQAN